MPDIYIKIDIFFGLILEKKVENFEVRIMQNLKILILDKRLLEIR